MAPSGLIDPRVISESLATNGFAWVPGVFDADAVARFIADATAALSSVAASGSLIGGGPGQRPHGARNLLRLWPAAKEIARTPDLAAILLHVLGPGAGVVRGLFFDKPPGDGWALPWHRDTTIAVKRHGALGAFGKPTVKAGVPHVEAPTELLDAMLALRVHLDAMTTMNGPLRVTPGSQHGDAGRPPETLYCEAGDVLLMRPRLLHASAGCEPDHAGHRRIVHLECAPSVVLTDGFEWDKFIPVGGRLDVSDRGRDSKPV